MSSGADARGAPNDVSTIRDIQRAVARRYRFSVNDLRSATRAADVVRARHLAMYLCRVLTLHSTPVIGRHFGGRDHATVVRAINNLSRRVERDQNLLGEAHSLISAINASTFACWRLDGPLDSVDAALNAVGYELAVVPIGTRDENGFARGFVRKTNRTATTGVQL